jgi:hypothetical protein
MHTLGHCQHGSKLRGTFYLRFIIFSLLLLFLSSTSPLPSPLYFCWTFVSFLLW